MAHRLAVHLARHARHLSHFAASGLFVAVALLVAPTPLAHAHGGRMLQPPEPPEAPEPPPPEPMPPKPSPLNPLAPGTPPPPPVTDTAPPPTPPPPTTPPPTAPGSTTPPTGGGETRPGGRARTGAQPPGWLTWWKLNRWAFLPDRDAVTRRTAPAVTPRAGESGDVVLSARAARRQAAKRVVPILLDALDARSDVPDEVRAAALLALAKVENARYVSALAARWIHDRSAAPVVRESAALSLGLLRRSDAARQASRPALAAARAACFAAYDDDQVPWRARTFALFSLGLLGDQPHENAFTRHGVLVVRGLWDRLLAPGTSHEARVALLKAVGMQSREGIAEAVVTDLRAIALGKRVARRRWSDMERSHALTALARLEVQGWSDWLLRMIASRHTPRAVTQAAWIALGAKAGALAADERQRMVRLWQRAERSSRETVTRGLALLACGRLTAGALADGDAALTRHARFGRLLVAETEGGAVERRCFAGLGLALAARGAKTSAPAFHAEACRTLTRAFERRSAPAVRAAMAVAMGLMADPELLAPLARTLEDRNASPELRGACAVALAQADARDPAVREALAKALGDRRSTVLRSEAALALSFLPRGGEGALLVREFGRARSQWVLGQVGAALGQLGDLGTLPDLCAAVKDATLADETRAIAVASLGLMLDPEPRPSLFRLTLDANYPSRSTALHEAFTIL